MADDGEPTDDGGTPDPTGGWGGSDGDGRRGSANDDRPGSTAEAGDRPRSPEADPGSTEGGGEEDHGTYEVFVQWQRGKPHEHAETVNAPDGEMALHLAKRNVDVRSEPVSIMVAPRSEIHTTAPGDTTLVPSTDRSYRNVGWYAEHRDDGGEG